jgi:hypothetical protein
MRSPRREPSRTALRRAAVLCGAVALGATAACTSLDVGSNIIWSDDFETGSVLSALNDPGGTGGLLDGGGPPGTTVVSLSDAEAHGGRYSALIAINSFPSTSGPLYGAGLFREGPLPKAAYYGAWYYIPAGAYQTVSGWNILKIKVPNDVDGSPGNPSERLSLSISSLPPDNNLALHLSDVRSTYLEQALPPKIPFVPVGRWFQIECFYNNSDASDGELTVWLDGVQVYDVHRQMTSDAWVYFAPCSLAENVPMPQPLLLYIDDVVISTTRAAPNAILRSTN